MSATQNPNTRSNGEVILGDVEYDGRVILYIIKGQSFLELPVWYCCR